ncbi:hypothetical protein QEN19_002757 [Hanseniaspora menglaensis]
MNCTINNNKNSLITAENFTTEPLCVRTKSLGSNNDIFERDVQIDVFPSTGRSVSSPDFLANYTPRMNKSYEIDPKNSSVNVVLRSESTSGPSFSLESNKQNVNGSFSGFNSNIFGSSPERKKSLSSEALLSTSVGGTLKKVPTHVFSVDNYINSDMDQKCTRNDVYHRNKNHRYHDQKETPRSNTVDPKQEFSINECVDQSNSNNSVKNGNGDVYENNILDEDFYDERNKSLEFDERMEYFDHNQTSFDNYINSLSRNHSVKSGSNAETSKLTELLQKKDEDESNEVIDNLTSDLLNVHLVSSYGNYLDSEEYENRRLDRERSRSLSSIIVKGLSDSFK